MTETTPIAPFLRRFLLEHLIRERNLSRNTQAGYRDTLILLLRFLAKTTSIRIDQLSVEDLSASSVRRFLHHLERDRRVSGATRNQRLVAIHSLARFIGEDRPEHLAWCNEIRAVPFKRTAHAPVPYLEKAEIEVLLAVPNRRTLQGARDHALLLFLYNTGARVEEAARLRVCDLQFGNSPAVTLLGKGNKSRRCPLWPQTIEGLKKLTANCTTEERVFLNRLHRPLTRFGIYALVRRIVSQARLTVPTLKAKRISPHCLRHACAVHMLRAGIDINTIRGWLGHVSLDTTHIYAEVDMEMKAKALARCDVPAHAAIRPWHTQPGVIAFLKSL
jgi:integrase/recombinase XerD